MDVVFEHVKYVKHLPEQKNAHQYQAVAEIQEAVPSQGPQGAGEKEEGHEGQHQGKGVQALKLGRGLATGLGRSGREDVQGPDQCRKADEQGEVGDVVYDAVFNNDRSTAPLPAKGKREHQIGKPGCIGHHQCAQHSAFEPFALQHVEAVDHEHGADKKQGQGEPWIQ